MTTLPQTLSSRARPAHGTNGVPAVASPVVTSLPMPMGPSPAAGQMTAADVWRVFRQNLWLILLAGLLSAAAGYGVYRYLDRHHQTWRAEAAVMVQIPQLFDPLSSLGRIGQDRQIELKTIQQNHVQGLTSDRLFNDVIGRRAGPVRESDWLRERAAARSNDYQQGAREVLGRNFRARAIPDSSLIYVSMEAGNALEAQRILQEIVQVRIEEVRVQGSRSGDDEIRQLERLREEANRELGTLNREYTNLNRAITGDGSTVIAGGAGGMSAAQMEISNVVSALAAAGQAAAEAESALNSARQSIERGVDPPGVDMMIEQHPSILRMREELTQLDIAIGTRLNTPGSRTVRELETRRDVTRNKMADLEADMRASSRERLIQQLGNALDSARQDVVRLDAQRNSLNQMLADIESQRNQAELIRDNIVASRQRMAEVDQALITLRTAQSERQREELVWYNMPTIPTSPAFPQLPLTMGAAIVLGLGLAVGLAFLREMMDTSVKSPRDVARVGNMTVLGMIPDQSQDPQVGDDIELAVAKAPHSMTAEQFRNLRSRLGHVAPLDTTRTILVTSPGPGDGKTTVAANLAAGLALNGRRVLLADANLRRPAIHTVFKVSNDRGLADVLASADVLAEVVSETDVPNLSVLPAGKRPDDATELLEGAAFTELLDRALEDYDHVIFDSGPVLFVSETGAIAPQVDGVISVVRARKNSRGLLGRLRDSLASLNTEHLGVVLNAVRGQAGGYYNRNIKTYYAYLGDGRSN